jgi:hypothetical protein
MVNLLGERFMNEEIMPNTTFTGNAISRQKNRTAFLIFDEIIITTAIKYWNIAAQCGIISSWKRSMHAD